MNAYIEQDGKKLRLGYTTGSCAAAAAKAAAWMLLSGRRREQIMLETPKGITLTLAVEEIAIERNAVSCAVRKDAGDDPDITDGALVFAAVSFSDEPGVGVDGGEGVGRVTKPGLDQPVGNAAINSVPRRMIRENVEEVMRLFDYSGGLSVCISIPAGAELAKKTFNPRLGIVGGISVLGTTGIVEPMSEDALVDSIRVEIRQRKALGDARLVLTPGNYGADFLKAAYGVPDERIVKCSNYIGKALEAAADTGFTEALLAGHIGKLVKLSGGMMNTHSKEGDCRAELMAAATLRAGGDAETARTMFDCVTTDEMLRILEEKGMLPKTMEALKTRIAFSLRERFKDRIRIGVIVFTTGNRELFRDETARIFTEEFV